MVLAEQFISRLIPFAESFTGYPVKIIISSARESTEEKQTEGMMKIYIPYNLDSYTAKNNENLAFNMYKGYVALQASAALYDGILSFENKTDSLDDFVLSIEGGGWRQSSYPIIETTRRMQCIEDDYKVLAEDIREGFSRRFEANLFTYTKKQTSDKLRSDLVAQKIDTSVVNEIDLALTSVYWERLGVERKIIERVISEIPRDREFGEYREEFYTILMGLSNFSHPKNSSFRDSLQRSQQFSDYIDNLCDDLFLVRLSNYQITLEDEIKIKAKRGLSFERSKDNIDIKNKLIRRKKELENILENVREEKSVGLDTPEKIQKRINSINENIINFSTKRGLDQLTRELELKQFVFSTYYSTNISTMASLGTILHGVPMKSLIALEIPEATVKEERGKALYFPEIRAGVLESRAVRVTVYDLLINQPPTEVQNNRQIALEHEISKLTTEVRTLRDKRDDWIRYHEDIKDINKQLYAADRRLSHLQKELKSSREVYQELSVFPFEKNVDRIRRIQSDMEEIKPEARSIVRNCFEGELDEKKYFEYWLAEQQGNPPLPNFYYQWRNRQRDVASVLLVDASTSSQKIAFEDETLLDVVKKSVYEFSVAADSLEDKVAVMAYNGKSHRNVRLFLLKDFDEDLVKLERRLELLRPDINNRDGAAIRYATHYLSGYHAKTKFLFHISDMKPSDLEYEQEVTAINTFPYRGEEAANDVIHAFDTAKTLGIVPVGICIKKPEQEKISSLKGKLNPSVLKKLKEKKSGDQDISLERLITHFNSYYKVVQKLEDLHEILRSVYLELSFR